MAKPPDIEPSYTKTELDQVDEFFITQHDSIRYDAGQHVHKGMRDESTIVAIRPGLSLGMHIDYPDSLSPVTLYPDYNLHWETALNEETIMQAFFEFSMDRPSPRFLSLLGTSLSLACGGQASPDPSPVANELAVPDYDQGPSLEWIQANDLNDNQKLGAQLTYISERNPLAVADDPKLVELLTTTMLPTEVGRLELALQSLNKVWEAYAISHRV